LPHGIGWQIYKHFPIYKHYPFRSARLMLQKKAQHLKSGFSDSHWWYRDYDSCFVDKLPGYKQARRFDGSFHEFEIKDQGTLLGRWLRSGRYR
jgi:hypothetical protein